MDIRMDVRIVTYARLLCAIVRDKSFEIVLLLKVF